MFVFLQWFCFVVLAVVSALYTMGNYVFIFSSVFRKRRHSLVPLVGGCVGVITCFISPIQHVSHFWYVPLILDPGTGYLLIGMLLEWIVKSLKGRRR